MKKESYKKKNSSKLRLIIPLPCKKENVLALLEF